jgi:hypothetical protein
MHAHVSAMPKMGQPALHFGRCCRLDRETNPADHDVRGVHGLKSDFQTSRFDDDTLFALAAQMDSGAETERIEPNKPTSLWQENVTALRTRIERSLKGGRIIRNAVAHRTKLPNIHR